MKKLGSLVAAAAVAGLIAGAVVPAGAQNTRAPLKGTGKNMKIVANVPYQGGTDMEFATIKGNDYAFAASAPSVGGAKTGGLHVINVNNPAKPKEVAFLGCGLYQADIQLSFDKKYVYMAADSAGGPDSCLAVGKVGFLIIDIKNPLKPKAVGFAETRAGSHNVTAHPSKPYVYNSNSELVPGAANSAIEIWNVANPAKPVMVKSFASLPHPPHDISFNSDGTKIVTAQISSFGLYDTSDVENPTLIVSQQCPGCSITHDAKFTPDDKGLIIGDEGGGGGTYVCPGGALYFYQLQADTVPVLTGLYEPKQIVFPKDGQPSPGSCTSHVFDISDDGKQVAISWYAAGTRLLNVEAMMGVAVGDTAAGGVTEMGWFQPDGGSSWSSKFFKGEKYIFSNDINRGFDVFQYTGK